MQSSSATRQIDAGAAEPEGMTELMAESDETPKETWKRVAPGVYRSTSGRVRATVTVGDRRHNQRRDRRFPPGTSLRDVKRWQTDTRAELQREDMRPAKGTLDADKSRYMERVRRRLEHPDDRGYELAAWSKKFGHRARHTIKRDEIRQQVKDWLAAGIAASTVRHRLSALSSLYVELDGDDAYNPTRGVKRPKEPEPQPDSRPVEYIVRVLDELWYRAAMNNRGWLTLARALMLAHTGTRHSQLMLLDPDLHIRPFLDSDPPGIDIPAGKGGKQHWKPLDAHGVAACRMFLRVRAHGKFSTSALYKSWKLACKRAGVPFFNPYKLRHSYATRLRRYGADIADVQEALGHKSPKTTQRYAQVVVEKLVAATKRAEAAWESTRVGIACQVAEVAEKKRG